MQVETYECQETQTEHPECSDEALKLIAELGLAGQDALNTAPSGDKTRFPYRKMRADEAAVFTLLCPRTCKLTEYADSPIPLRVLQVAAHAKPLFDELIVWAAPNSDVKDPVLVGIKKKGEWTQERYILARWADALDEWPAVVKAAAEKFRDKLIAAAAEKMKDAMQYEAMAKGNITLDLMTKTTIY